MKYITAKKVKKGESYYFADTHFSYPNLFTTSISKAKVNKIIDGDFSTRNDGDRYEIERVIAFVNEKDARDYLIKEIKDRVKNIKQEAKEAVNNLLIKENKNNEK